MPIASKSTLAGTLTMVLDLVNIVNGIKSDAQLPDDTTGKNTLEYLRKCKRVIDRINGNEPFSLGLHPAIFFYSKGGRRKVASILAVAALMLEFEKDKSLLDKFTTVRAKFEELVKDHDYLVQQVVRKHHARTGIKSYEDIKDLYLVFIKKLLEGRTVENVIDELTKDPSSRFGYLKRQTEVHEGESGKDFSREVKSAAYITAALARALTCPICGGLIHVNAISTDHIVRKEDGGTNTLANAQPAHYYCNTTFKH